MTPKHPTAEVEESLQFADKPERFQAVTALRTLAAEVRRLRASWPKVCQNCHGTGYFDSDGICGECDAGRIRMERDMAKELLKLAEQRVKELEADARRYRGLRELCLCETEGGAVELIVRNEYTGPADKWRDGVDAAIDAAIKQEQEEGK